ncbi:hypothetical protein S245_061079, partial [Arachis hypogaea]
RRLRSPPKPRRRRQLLRIRRLLQLFRRQCPVVDHTSPSASLDIFGFSDLDPSYSQSPFELVHVAENGNDNGYHDDSVFVSDEPVLPAPTEMRSEEGYAL